MLTTAPRPTAAASKFSVIVARLIWIVSSTHASKHVRQKPHDAFSFSSARTAAASR
jgi:hypothetical protein